MLQILQIFKVLHPFPYLPIKNYIYISLKLTAQNFFHTSTTWINNIDTKYAT